MTNFANRIAGLATLALAALPIIGLAGSAHAAPQPVRIVVSDLDLNSHQGMAKFRQRANDAADTFCRDGRQSSPVAGCKAALRGEIAGKLASAQQTQLASRNTALASR